MPKDKFIALSFDVEEFDLPLEYGQTISVDEQLEIGYKGLLALMPLLQQPYLQTTLFTTAFFASHFPNEMRQLAEQHEIASHTYYHTRFEVEDLYTSRIKLEEITGKKVEGLRMPRMRSVETKDVKAAGYRYSSSINPTWIPGRYNNLRFPRKPFQQDGILQVPTSVTPLLRIPLFWLAFKNMPYNFYKRLLLYTLKNDGSALLYFHPWEFTDLSAYALPKYVKKDSGPVLLEKLTRLINDLSTEGDFCSLSHVIQTKIPLPSA